MISLLACFDRSATEVYANDVIVGFHTDGPDPTVSFARAVIEQLREWWGKKAFSFDSAQRTAYALAPSGAGQP
jgi:hypothetical protein